MKRFASSLSLLTTVLHRRSSSLLFDSFTTQAMSTKGPLKNIDDVVSLIQSASKILVVAGAGLSVSCGIPDFRSENGLYSKVAKEFPQLGFPERIFDIELFHKDPQPFFQLAKNLYAPGVFKPSPTHRFLAELEKKGKLLRVYTQNIDCLENDAGLTHQRVITCHGSFEKSTCTKCKRQIDSINIADHFHSGTIAYCHEGKKGGCKGVLKPNVVFFGESLPDRYHDQLPDDTEITDLVIVVGTSLQVMPVGGIPFMIKNKVPQILINREHLSHVDFDVELIGECDVVTKYLRCRLGWHHNDDCPKGEQLPEFKFSAPNRFMFVALSSLDAEMQKLKLSEPEKTKVAKKNKKKQKPGKNKQDVAKATTYQEEQTPEGIVKEEGAEDEKDAAPVTHSFNQQKERKTEDTSSLLLTKEEKKKTTADEHI